MNVVADKSDLLSGVATSSARVFPDLQNCFGSCSALDAVLLLIVGGR